MRVSCAGCGRSVELVDKVCFGAVCPSCSAYLHACRNCASWRNGSCSEPQAERPRDSEGKNFCDWFRPRGDGGGPRASGGREQAEAMWRKMTGKGSG